MNQQYRTHKLIHNFTIDFNKLALLHPPLRKHVLILNDRVVCNFTSQETLIILAEAIMKHIFRLEWTCPPGNLCPRIPSRVNYLLWLHLQLPKVETVVDVGTGATLIYPLIGWSLFRWKFIAIQLNQQSLQSSRKLVQVNKLEDVIELRNSSENDMESILHETIGEEEKICLLVCNPPFFEEQADKLSIMQSQQHHIQGGQYAFFFSLYRDSFRYRYISYFSCLLGRSTDFHQIRDFLSKEHKEGFLKMVRFGEIAQGRNIRFIVLWSLSDILTIGMFKPSERRFEYNIHPQGDELERYNKYPARTPEYSATSTATPLNKRASLNYSLLDQHSQIPQRHEERFEPRARVSSETMIKRSTQRSTNVPRAKPAYEESYRQAKKVYFGEEDLNTRDRNRPPLRDENRRHNGEEFSSLQENVGNLGNVGNVKEAPKRKGQEISELGVNEKEIMEKIGRINRLNEEINNRLQRMLSKIDGA